MNTRVKLISKKCGKLSEVIKFKKLDCNFSVNREELKKSKNVVILGNFDGVHKGHARIFSDAVEKAKKMGYKTVVYTFREYPFKLENRITTPSEKVELIDRHGIDYIYMEEFEDVREQTPDEFVEKVLMETLNAAEIYCGFNFTFGKGKSGNIRILDNIIDEKYKDRINLNIVNPILDEDNIIISSTRIRRYIEKTDFHQIKKLLGHNPIIMGEVIHGKKLGRTFGFPTANLTFKNKVYPHFGVYGVYVQIEGFDEIFHGVMNIGKNPTIEENGLSVETYILNFDEYIYGKIIMIEILEKISDEIKLNSIEELIEKIDKDTEIWKKRIKEKYYDTGKNR